MKRYLTAIAAVLLAVGMCVSPSSGEISVSISIGDQPYYYGPTYWDSGYEFIWVPGYDEHGHWVHGHYKRHGKFNREHAKDHRKKDKKEKHAKDR